MIKTGDLVSTAEAAKMLGKSIRTVHRMAQDGRIPAVKLGAGTSSWVFDRADVEAAARDAA